MPIAPPEAASGLMWPILAAEDTLTSIFLRIEYDSRALEMPELRSNACGLDYTAIDCNVAEEDCHATILGVGMLDVADTAVLTVGIERWPLSILRAHLGRELASRC